MEGDPKKFWASNRAPKNSATDQQHVYFSNFSGLFGVDFQYLDEFTDTDLWQGPIMVDLPMLHRSKKASFLGQIARESIFIP